MNTGEKPKLKVPEAKGLCDECIEKESKIVDDDAIVVCYCEHNSTGGLFQVDKGLWRLTTPIFKEDFQRVSTMQREGIKKGKNILKAKGKPDRRFDN